MILCEQQGHHINACFVIFNKNERIFWE